MARFQCTVETLRYRLPRTDMLVLHYYLSPAAELVQVWEQESVAVSVVAQGLGLASELVLAQAAEPALQLPELCLR